MSNSDRPLPENNQVKLPQSSPSQILEVKWSCRWEIFRRLQTLGIECKCSTNEPLLVCLHSPTTIIQIWSVLRQRGASRSSLIDWLDDCWQLKGDAVDYFRDRQFKEK